MAEQHVPDISPQVTTTSQVAQVPPPLISAPPATAQPAPVSPVAPSSDPSGMARAENEHRPGIEGEFDIWEGRYSLKNFLGRLSFRVVLTLGLIALALYSWSGNPEDRGGWRTITMILGIALIIYWAILVYRILLAWYGHFYRLTNRRLFVSSGLFQRRRDQLELVQIDDVFTRQSFWQRLVGVGTVVVNSKNNQLPHLYLTGVDEPKAVMDLIWHHARAERDQRSVKVDQV